ncbi:alpha/beta hydrolase [Paraburkholderia caballeronis]|uniref:alpha/beta hydrolase n=1 Tax=Paraburkholderia caballeronis TaxID=416943 RepID=UPI0010668005|nr:alpha/beta hydrolase [Paraburkholderia caballeronis]TDV18386.1 acetyl esterase/lipase [Paraburkholderia caballeronis]TDV20076.1 acetyl esterase/lipase [Paraburkholderia caballeronis]TDV28293.1 acetyl esterase/lipase [Paraburkholderia caballeronis]
MSWQGAVIRWTLRRTFRPATEQPIDVDYVRTRTSKRLWTPRAPSGWRLREQYDAAPLRGEWLVRRRAPGQPAPRTILYLHGGGYYFCSPKTHRAITFGLAMRADADLFSLDYRLAPEHPFPAALDDALAAWRSLLDSGVRADSIVIGGDSAGGGLALATLVALRDAGGPLPAGAVLFSPWTDLATTGASLRDNDGRDPMFRGEVFERVAPLYLGATPATHPLASPLYAELHGLPPLFLRAGSTEVLVDDTRRVAARAADAGVEIDCAVWPDMPHIWPIYAPFMPEARRVLDEAAGFARRATGGGHAPGGDDPRAAQSSETSIA